VNVNTYRAISVEEGEERRGGRGEERREREREINIPRMIKIM